MKCNYCEWRCELSEKDGICHMYEQKDGEIVEKHKNEWSRCTALEMERIPFYHYHPDSRVLQIGSFNCNAACAYCINASIAISREKDYEPFVLTPEEVIELAKKGNYKFIHFGINEVTVNLPSAIEIAKLAKKENISVGCSTNGFMTEYSAELMAQYFDFFNVSLKSISSEFYRKNLGLSSVDPIIRNIKYFAKHAHLEITTPIVNKGNENEILPIAKLLADIDKDIVWHIFRLVPENAMSVEDVPDVKNVSKLVEQARNILHNIYFGNFIGSNWVDTTCKNCGEIAIERLCDCACGARIMSVNINDDATCKKCGAKLPIIM